MSTIIILQARMGSTRLPGKIFKQIDGKSLLAYEVERLHRIEGIDRLVIATTTNSLDDPVEDFCKQESISIYRGSEQDVLDRYYQAAKIFDGETIVRISGDCPLIDPEITANVISKFSSGDDDYVSNTLRRSYPRGMDTEVFSFRALETAWAEAKEPSEREHVTPFIWQRPERFKLREVWQENDESHYRLTVDTPEDFRLIEKIIHALYPKNPRFTKNDVVDLLGKHPEWLTINAHVRQKEV